MRLFSEPDKFYKVVPSNFGPPFIHHYTKGYNQYIFKDEERPDSGTDGMYFTNIKYIFAYLDYGSVLLEATFPDGTHMGITKDNEIDGYNLPEICVDKCIIINAYSLSTPGLIQRLIMDGADISVLDYNVYKWAYKHCAPVWQFLIQIYGMPPEIEKFIYSHNGYQILEKGEF